MKKKRIFKEPTRYSNLFSKVLSINLAIPVTLNQRRSAAAEQMRPSEELYPKIKLVPNECTQKPQ